MEEYSSVEVAHLLMTRETTVPTTWLKHCQGKFSINSRFHPCLTHDFTLTSSFKPLKSKTFFRLQAAATGATSVPISVCIDSESLLLRTYKVDLPERPRVLKQGVPDKVSIQILKRYDPTILLEYVPLDVEGDGNCLYR